jgi:hypothetical protein
VLQVALAAVATEQVLQAQMLEQVPQTQVAAVAAERHWMIYQPQVAAPASSLCGIASLNFSTGEANETIDSGHCCGTDLDGLRYKPRRLLQRHRCA